MPTPPKENAAPVHVELLLEVGDRLSRVEFERRYERMPHIKKAELIEELSTCPLPSGPKPMPFLTARWPGGWLLMLPVPPGLSAATTPASAWTCNEPQPDLVMLKPPAKGGQARVSADDYIEGAPEMVVKSSAVRGLTTSIKRKALTAATEFVSTWPGSRASVAWSGGNCAKGMTKEIIPGSDGLLRSRAFPGLWLDGSALLNGEMKAVLGSATTRPEQRRARRILRRVNACNPPACHVTGTSLRVRLK